MKRLLTFLVVIFIISVPCMANAEYQEGTSNTPPIAQPVVREGELAVKLVQVLNLGTAKDEAQAETMLGAAGIAPANGWIADFPVTPDILGELRNGIRAAAESGKLKLSRDEALQAFRDVAAKYGLSLMAENQMGMTADQQTQEQATANYPNQTTINNYYDYWGPPIVTWYPPPWDYGYLYAWVPYPFWCRGFWFRGYYCLRDFDRPIFWRGHRRICTNHVIVDQRTRDVVTIDPLRRAMAGRGFKLVGDGAPSRNAPTAALGPSGRAVPASATAPVSGTHNAATTSGIRPVNGTADYGQVGRFATPEAKSGALAILNRSHRTVGTMPYRGTDRGYSRAAGNEGRFTGMGGGQVSQGDERAPKGVGSFTGERAPQSERAVQGQRAPEGVRSFNGVPSAPAAVRGNPGGFRGSVPASGGFRGAVGQGFSGGMARGFGGGMGHGFSGGGRSFR